MHYWNADADTTTAAASTTHLLWYHIWTGLLPWKTGRLYRRICFAIHNDCAQLSDDLLQFLHLIQLHLNSNGDLWIWYVGPLTFHLLQMSRKCFLAEQHRIVAALVQGILYEINTMICVTRQQLQCIFFLIQHF